MDLSFRMNFDLIIKNGMIIDGTGNPWFKFDVGIIGDEIKKISRFKETKANRIIDAENLVVTPGFIDIHSHSDIPVLVDPKVQSKIFQGVTTEVIGNCGNSAAPMNASLREYREKYARTRVPEDFKFDWVSMKDYLNRIDYQGSAFNVVALVGHGTVRQNIMGHEDRRPSDSELKKMKKLVYQAMKDGAFGISTGLIYPPSVYGDKEEIIELVNVVTKFGGIYASHIRGEGSTLLEAVKEAGEIGLLSGAPVQIAHFKASGKPYWGKTKESLDLVEEYRRKGVDVTFDQYPYIASSTGLAALFPHWAHRGGAAEMIERLKDPDLREQMKKEMRLRYDWKDILIVYAKNNPVFNGMNIQEIADTEEKNPYAFVCDLLIDENNQVPAVMFGMNEEDVRRVMQSPYGMIASDGSAVSPEGVLGQGNPHPRYYGTFPRVLGHYVRDGVITLQEAVRKMTSAPAQKIGLKDRGLLREGYKADIVLFDPDTVKDEATFINPHRFASGIPYVIVNGIIVIEKCEHTRKLPGRTIRNQNYENTN
jgi:N-acyl-D-amino-acid deacylase